MADIGLIGLGTMGANLALNMAENGGATVAVYNRTKARTDAFMAAAGGLAGKLVPCDSLEELIAEITPQREWMNGISSYSMWWVIIQEELWRAAVENNPAVLAKSALTINELSGGRFTLGVGTGWLEREHTLFGFPFPDVATRFEMMEEALAYVRAMITGDAAGFSGDHFVLDDAETLPRDPGLRLVVGGRAWTLWPVSPEQLAPRLRLLHQADDLRQRSIRPHPRRAAVKQAAAVQRA